jgi:hypothetical protein
MQLTKRLPLTVTPGDLRWLEQLERDGIACRGRGPNGFRCMHRGWTEWVLSNGAETIGWAEFYARFPDNKPWDDWKNIGEQLTKQGREALAEHRKTGSVTWASKPPLSVVTGGRAA